MDKEGAVLKASPTSHLASDPATIAERLQRLESEHDLLRYELDGWCVWPVLRFTVASILENYSFSAVASLRVRRLALIALRDLPSFLWPRKSKYAVITFSSARMERVNGKYKDVFFDDFLLDAESFFKIEKINSVAFWSRSSLVKADVASIFVDLLHAFVLARFRVRAVSEVAEQISKVFAATGEFERISRERIEGILHAFLWRKRVYKWLLARIQPRHLFTADGYTDYDIMAAAKELGIEVIEFQHGIVSRKGAEYTWPGWALKYRKKMPIPDRMFLYGEYWKREIAGEFWGSSLRVTGSLRVDGHRKRRADCRRTTDTVNLVMTTSRDRDDDKSAMFLADFLELADGSDVHLYVKLHPLWGDGSTYAKALQRFRNVTLVAGTDEPSTFDLLVEADLHVSVQSACHFEALALGVPTAILPFRGSEFVLDLVVSGHGFLVQSPNDLLDLVSVCRSRGVPEAVRNFYFQSGTLENMKHELSL